MMIRTVSTFAIAAGLALIGTQMALAQDNDHVRRDQDRSTTIDRDHRTAAPINRNQAQVPDRRDNSNANGSRAIDRDKGLGRREDRLERKNTDHDRDNMMSR
jgi:hypothetical protein